MKRTLFWNRIFLVGLPSNLESTIIDLINNIPNETINGDFNQDGILNVVDVVSIINLVLT